MIATKDSIEPQSGEPLPNSSRVCVSGKIHPDVRVPFREVNLSPTKSFNGQLATNAPVRVYDCSGPWGDAAFTGNVEQGLPPLRREWILARGDVEQGATSYKPIAGRSDATIPPALQRNPLHATRNRAHATWAASPSAPASPRTLRPSSSAPKWPGAAPSSRPTLTTRRASR